VIAVVQLFAGARELLAGMPAMTVELPSGATVGELRSALRRDLSPAFAALIVRSRIAVDCEFADDSAVIPDGAELALIPPVSGGAA